MKTQLEKEKFRKSKKEDKKQKFESEKFYTKELI